MLLISSGENSITATKAEHNSTESDSTLINEFQHANYLADIVTDVSILKCNAGSVILLLEGNWSGSGGTRRHKQKVKQKNSEKNGAIYRFTGALKTNTHT